MEAEPTSLADYRKVILKQLKLPFDASDEEIRAKMSTACEMITPTMSEAMARNNLYTEKRNRIVSQIDTLNNAMTAFQLENNARNKSAVCLLLRLPDSASAEEIRIKGEQVQARVEIMKEELDQEEKELANDGRNRYLMQTYIYQLSETCDKYFTLLKEEQVHEDSVSAL